MYAPNRPTLFFPAMASKEGRDAGHSSIVGDGGPAHGDDPAAASSLGGSVRKRRSVAVTNASGGLSIPAEGDSADATVADSPAVAGASANANPSSPMGNASSTTRAAAALFAHHHHSPSATTTSSSSSSSRRAKAPTMPHKALSVRPFQRCLQMTAIGPSIPSPEVHGALQLQLWAGQFAEELAAIGSRVIACELLTKRIIEAERAQAAALLLSSPRGGAGSTVTSAGRPNNLVHDDDDINSLNFSATRRQLRQRQRAEDLLNAATADSSTFVPLTHYTAPPDPLVNAAANYLAIQFAPLLSLSSSSSSLSLFSSILKILWEVVYIDPRPLLEGLLAADGAAPPQVGTSARAPCTPNRSAFGARSRLAAAEGAIHSTAARNTMKSTILVPSSPSMNSRQQRGGPHHSLSVISPTPPPPPAAIHLSSSTCAATVPCSPVAVDPLRLVSSSTFFGSLAAYKALYLAERHKSEHFEVIRSCEQRVVGRAVGHWKLSHVRTVFFVWRHYVAERSTHRDRNRRLFDRTSNKAIAASAIGNWRLRSKALHLKALFRDNVLMTDKLRTCAQENANVATELDKQQALRRKREMRLEGLAQQKKDLEQMAADKAAQQERLVALHYKLREEWARLTRQVFGDAHSVPKTVADWQGAHVTVNVVEGAADIRRKIRRNRNKFNPDAMLLLARVLLPKGLDEEADAHDDNVSGDDDDGGYHSPHAVGGDATCLGVSGEHNFNGSAEGVVGASAVGLLPVLSVPMQRSISNLSVQQQKSGGMTPNTSVSNLLVANGGSVAAVSKPSSFVLKKPSFTSMPPSPTAAVGGARRRSEATGAVAKGSGIVHVGGVHHQPIDPLAQEEVLLPSGAKAALACTLYRRATGGMQQPASAIDIVRGDQLRQMLQATVMLSLLAGGYCSAFVPNMPSPNAAAVPFASAITDLPLPTSKKCAEEAQLMMEDWRRGMAAVERSLPHQRNIANAIGAAVQVGNTVQSHRESEALYDRFCQIAIGAEFPREVLESTLAACVNKDDWPLIDLLYPEEGGIRSFSDWSVYVAEVAEVEEVPVVELIRRMDDAFDVTAMIEFQLQLGDEECRAILRHYAAPIEALYVAHSVAKVAPKPPPADGKAAALLRKRRSTVSATGAAVDSGAAGGGPSPPVDTSLPANRDMPLFFFRQALGLLAARVEGHVLDFTANESMALYTQCAGDAAATMAGRGGGEPTASSPPAVPANKGLSIRGFTVFLGVASCYCSPSPFLTLGDKLGEFLRRVFDVMGHITAECGSGGPADDVGSHRDEGADAPSPPPQTGDGPPTPPPPTVRSVSIAEGS